MSIEILFLFSFIVGVMMPSIPNDEVAMKLAVTGEKNSGGNWQGFINQWLDMH